MVLALVRDLSDLDSKTILCHFDQSNFFFGQQVPRQMMDQALESVKRALASEESKCGMLKGA